LVTLFGTGFKMKTIISQCAVLIKEKDENNSVNHSIANESVNSHYNDTKTRTDGKESPDLGLTKLKMARTITEAKEAPDKGITRLR
jgi:hypothetical protein